MVDEGLGGGLGRRVPSDWRHLEEYPYRRLAPEIVDYVKRVMVLPYWHWSHDQGNEGACVGFGGSMVMAITNLIQRRDSVPQIKPFAVRYDPWWLWDRSKEIDEWPDTNPGDSEGTSVRASMDILRVRGHVQVANTFVGRSPDPKPAILNGIAANRWALTVDEMRTAISKALPVSIGVNWYSNFDSPSLKSYNEYWIGKGDLGRIRGGHCVAVFGADDDREAFKVKNSWGRDYPLVWMPYATMQRLINEDGEAAIITDR